MDRQSSGIENEIYLGAYINIIRKRKKIILSIFSVFAVFAVLIGLITPKMYQATTLIMIMPSKAQGILTNENLSLGFDRKAEPSNYAAQKSIPTHEALLKTNVVLEKVIDRLELADSRGIKLSPPSIAGALVVKQTKDTNILELIAEAPDAKKAMELSSAWAQEYIKYNQEIIYGEVKGMGDLISDQFEIAKKKLEESEAQTRDFLNANKIDLMRKDLDSKKEVLINNKKGLSDLETVLNTNDNYLKEYKKELGKQKEFIVLTKTVSNGVLLQQNSGGANAADGVSKKLMTEEVNPIYRNLNSRAVDTEIEINIIRPKIEYMNNAIAAAEKETGELQNTLNQKEFELTQLYRQADIYRRTYNNLSTKIEDARIAKGLQLGEVKIVSPAIAPERSMHSRKMQNGMAICLFGLICGLSSAFLMDFFENLKKRAAR
jgi:polysaccharide biosynthesis transport protein